MVYESTLERDLAYILLTHPRVQEVREQPEAIKYIDRDGIERKHTFDFLAHLTDGTRVAIAVKPASKVESSGIIETLDCIRAHAPSGFANRFELRTGDHITRDRAANARLIFKSRRMRNEDDVETVSAVVSTIRGTIRVSALLAASRNDGRGFMAVVSLIDDGVLEHVGPGRICHDSFVRPTRPASPTH